MHEAIRLPSSARARGPVCVDWRTPPMRVTTRAGANDHPNSTPSTTRPIRIDPWVLTHATHSSGSHSSQRGLARALVSTSSSSGSHTSEKSRPRSLVTTPAMPMASRRTMATTRPPLAPSARA